MTSTNSSPTKRSLRLARKHEELNPGPNKRAKLDSTSVDESANKKENFMKACLKVSYENYKEFRKRFQLLYLPSCADNVCTHDKKTTNLKQITKSVEQKLKIEIDNNTWHEALQICVACTTSSQYLSSDVLKDVVEIILNAHEDLISGYDIENLLKKCQHTLFHHFNTHPPCAYEDIRKCYKKFLTSPMDKKEDTFSNRKKYLSDEGIVIHCLTRLAYEISTESLDGTLVNTQEAPKEINGVKGLHWKKENLELFEYLDRTNRIERLMLVLESLVYLLLTDLALCRSMSKCQSRTQQPLLVYVLWPKNCLIYGTVTTQCRRVMELFAFFIHLQYPETHIKTMSMWMNAVIELIYKYEHGLCYTDYPSAKKNSREFAIQFCKIISSLPNETVLKIVERIQPSYMRYLIGETWVGKVLKTQLSISKIITNFADDNSWKNYPECGEPKIGNPYPVKPHKWSDFIWKKCRGFLSSMETDDSALNLYPKLNLLETVSQTKQDCFIDILFITYFAYMDAYDMKNFNQTLEQLNENSNCTVESDYDPNSCKPYIVTQDYVKEYRNMVQRFQELLVLLKKRRDVHSKKLLCLINTYFS